MSTYHFIWLAIKATAFAISPFAVYAKCAAEMLNAILHTPSPEVQNTFALDAGIKPHIGILLKGSPNVTAACHAHTLAHYTRPTLLNIMRSP